MPTQPTSYPWLRKWPQTSGMQLGQGMPLAIRPVWWGGRPVARLAREGLQTGAAQ